MRRKLANDGWLFRSRAARQLGMDTAALEWAAVALPHDAMIGTERSPIADAANGYFPAGVWEYRKRLEVAATASESQVLLEFEGVYRDAIVRVNGTVAAHRPYGYTTFRVPIGQFLRRDGSDEIRVEAQAGRDSRWYTGGGIYRNVWLLTGQQVHLVPGGLQVCTPRIGDDAATIVVSASVRNTSTATAVVQMQVELADPTGSVVAEGGFPVTVVAGETVIARQRMRLPRPQRWRLEQPDQYECRVALTNGGKVGDFVDYDATKFGIRSFTVDPEHGLLLNGEPVLLRGACVHHDNGIIGAASIDRAEERRVQLLKLAGFNAIRSAHNPMSKAMLDACDRLGVIVMDEAFDMWLEPKSTDDYGLRFADWWEVDIEAMVEKDLNHPSVLFYSIGNEIPDGSTSVGLRVGRHLADKIRELDGTRLVTQAINGLLVGGTELFAQFRAAAATSGTDEHTPVNAATTNLFYTMGPMMTSDLVTNKLSEAVSFLDVAGYNYMESRLQSDHRRFPYQVIVASETYPATMDTGWAAVTANPHVIGDFTWTGWDYLGEAGIGRTVFATEHSSPGTRGFMGEYPWLTAGCGDIDITGQRRPQSYYREIVFGFRADPYIAVRRPESTGKQVVYSTPWSWSDVISTWTWECEEGAAVTVEVYSDAEEVELVINGRSLGCRPAGSKCRYRAEFDVPYESGHLLAVAYRGRAEVGRMELRSASGPVVLDARLDRSQVRADGTDLAFVSIALVDEAGSLYNTADRRVEITLDGPGVLQGMGSANPRTEEAFNRPSCTTFHGRALAVIRPTGEGTTTATLSAQGCESQCLILQAGSAP